MLVFLISNVLKYFKTLKFQQGVLKNHRKKPHFNNISKLTTFFLSALWAIPNNCPLAIFFGAKIVLKLKSELQINSRSSRQRFIASANLRLLNPAEKR